MLTVRVLATAAASIALMLAFTSAAQAVELVGYRGLRLGMTMADARKVPGSVPGDATVVHKRPYDRYRVEGLTPQDMVDGVSRIYGTATNLKMDIPLHSIYGESAAVIERWQQGDCAWNLVRTGDGVSFALVGLSARLEALSLAAVTEAARLDVAEAPQREAAHRAKLEADETSAREKARTNNKSAFRP